MKKIIVAMVIALAVSVVFAGCSGTSGGEVTDTTQSTVMDSGSADTDARDNSTSNTSNAVTGANGSTVDKNDNLSENLSDAVTDASDNIDNATE